MTRSENKTTKTENYRVLSHLQTYICSGSFFKRTLNDEIMFSEASCLIILTASSARTFLVELDGTQITIPAGNSFITHVDKGVCLRSSMGRETSDYIALILCERFIANFGLQSLLNSEFGSTGTRIVRTTSRSTFLIKQIATIDQDKNSPLDQLLLNSRLFELLHCQSKEVVSEDSHIQSIHYDKMQLAKRVIHQDLSKVITIPELAKIVGTNEQYLKKYFKVYNGKTIAQYTIEVKMDHARKLLSNNKLRVTDVSRMVGYKHSTHFTTTFKKHFGFKPTLLK
ncbi:helix-turn-helix transcriptional regulator [Sphingobacterium sp. lm-10]|uniref:helix-turn-helix domain-containing protein n=1 Tax=Sphingobacterium sp. lm-10 TaxID=2944904 RepID=UPI002020567A|nr:helix-turn-helix domain-containing protein [Sphingobacterium sp. lm-10]MCL7989487.1 helix-turn-helix transcriptional regulator [Sphingobacterium sp. lm-10]